MKLVLTNDDGIEAPGLEALLEACAGRGERLVLAPAEPCSGVGHQVTTREPILLEWRGPDRVAVAGTPADCARIALRHLAPDADWLLAGINHGGNLGADLHSSGTAAAAREAALLGCPAIAVSHYVAPGRTADWKLAARRAAAVLEDLLGRPPGAGRFWNVNLPHPEHSRLDLEVVFCEVDPGPLDVRFRAEGPALVYEGDYHGRPRLEGHDVALCFGGRITVSAVRVD